MAYEKSDKKSQKLFRILRLVFLGFFLIASTLLGILHQYSTAMRPVSVDALDPFGGIESALTLIATGKMLEKIAWSSFILLFATILAALVFRRVFCGKVCAFGALQELFARLGKGMFGKHFEVPRIIDRPARYLKYVTLAAIVVLSVATGTLFIRPYDPWAAFHHIASSELLSGFLIGLILLIVSLVGSLFYNRFFCKYLCPMGGFLGLINRLGWFRVKRNDPTCIHCYVCDKVCPVNIPVESLSQVQSYECINCNLCVNACPVKDTLFIGGPKRGNVSSLAVLVLTLVIFIGVVGITTATGGFEWKVKSLTETVKESGAVDPEEIKGTNTFKEVSDLTKIPKEEFLERFKVSAEDFEKPIRDVAHREGSGFDTQAVRDFVKEKLGK